MKNNTISPNSLKATQIIFYALLIGQVLIGLAVYYIMNMDAGEQEVQSPYNIVIPLLVVVGIAASRLIWQKQKANIPNNLGLNEKQEHYKRSFVLRAALAEGCNLLALVLAFLFADNSYLLWFGIGLAAFILLRPTLDGFAEEYQLNQTERDQVK